MSDKNKEEKNSDLIPQKIIDSISSLDPEALFRSESSPACIPESFDVSEFLDESKKKKKEKEKEKEYKIGNYLIKKTLGQGTFGKVKLGIYLPSQEKVAIKILEKDRILEIDDEIRVNREFDMLAQFNHPNVILVAEIFESPDSFFSVMEFCEGGELFNFIVKNRRLSEEEAAFFYYQLINGLEYIHSLGIVHRDLKPENLLLTKDYLLKIIDFGLSNYFKKGQKELLVTPCGSPCYASPEMVAGKRYNGFKIDIWSTGIILYAMLCGYLPFEDKDNEILFEKILECKLEFPRYISETSKDLIEKILVTDPDKRISIPEIKKHPFFLKGKELFEQEFSICVNDTDDTDVKYINMDIKNILDSSIFKDNPEIIDISDKKEKEKQNEKNKNKLEIEEKETKINDISDKKRNKEKNISIKDLEHENIIQRLNTDYDENHNNLRKAILINLDKNENNEIRHRNNSSVKKNKRNNAHNRNSATNRNNNKKIIGPFKRRDIVYMKNNKNNEKKLLKKDNKNKINKLKDYRNNKKLVKTNNYNNIAKHLVRKKAVGKSVDLRSLKYKNNKKNLIQKKINYTNIIKNKFNSKENIRKNENIYINNINNTIDEESLINKKYLNYNFKIYNSSVNRPKKTRSVAKKNTKLASLENTFVSKNKKYLDNLITINSSIKRYENKLNNIGYHNPKSNNKNNNLAIKYNLLMKNSKNNNQNTENNLNKSKIKPNKEKMKIPPIKTNTINNTNENINIIDNTQDESNSIENNIIINNNTNNNNSISINNLNNGKNKISPKNIGYYIKRNRENLVKKNVKMNRVRLLKHNSNLNNNNNQGNIKVNYYLNEIDQKKTLDTENYKTHKPGIHTDIFDYSEIKTNKNANLKKKMINDYKNKSINNKTDIIDKVNTSFIKKKRLMINNKIIKHNSGYKELANTLKTEPNRMVNTTKKIKRNKNKYYNNNNDKTDKKKLHSKKISTANTNNLNPKNKNPKNINRQNEILSNNTKNLNKTINNFNFNTINSNTSKKNPFNQNNPNILELINTSSPNYNSSLNKKMNINSNNNRKNSQLISNNNKKPLVTIKNTFINLNIDTGFILSSSIDKKRKPKNINSKRATNNSISQINNNHIYDLDSKYNKYLTNVTNDEIDNINKSTNENYPIKTKTINGNYNIFSLNDDNDSNNNLEIINKNPNYQKIYMYGVKSGFKKNLKINNNIKDSKNDNSKLNNRTVNNTNDKRHAKYKSMKLDDYLSVKNRKKEFKDIYINNNENAF